MGKPIIRKLIEYADQNIQCRAKMFLTGIVGLVIVVAILYLIFGVSGVDEQMALLDKALEDHMTPFNLILLGGFLFAYVVMFAAFITPFRNLAKELRHGWHHKREDD